MIEFLYRNLRNAKFKKISSFKQGCWVNVTQPTTEELELLTAKLKLDRGHLNDAIDPFEVPRVEKEGPNLYLFLRVPIKQGEHIITTPCLFILTDICFITISLTEYPLWQKVSMRQDFHSTQKAKSLVLLLMAVLNHYHSTIISLSRQINERLSKVENISNDDVLTLIKLESSINELLGAMIPLREALSVILSGKLIQFFPDDRELIEDLYLSAGQVVTLAKNQLAYVRNSRDAYTTILTNTLNRVVKLFTSLTVVLTVPTIVASFYGMNIALPLADHPYAFVIILLLTVGMVSGLVWYFDRRKWL